MINESINNIGFKTPIVGVHIRKTEKIAEAKYFPLETYMQYVNQYYEQLEVHQKHVERKVLLLTDDPIMLIEAREKFPDYIFITNEKSANLVNSIKIELVLNTWHLQCLI